MALTRFAALVVTALAATACVSEPPRPRLPQLGVTTETATWRISDASLSSGPGAVAQQASSIAQDYLRSGSGPISAVVAAPDLTRASLWAGNLARAFAQEGVMPEQIETTPIVSPYAPGAVVSYRSASVIIPECDRRPTRASYLHGCETDRYLGRMVANPADLLGERGTLGDRDGMRSAMAVDQYRRGEVKSDEPKSGLRSTTKVTE